MWNPKTQRTIRAVSLLLASLAIVAAAVWLLYFSEKPLNSIYLKNIYTTLQIRGEDLKAREWCTISFSLVLASLIGVPSGLQFIVMFSFISPFKAWAIIILTQTVATFFVIFVGKHSKIIVENSLPSELLSAISEAGDSVKLAWFLRMFLGIPNRTIDAALASQISQTATPLKLAFYSLPGHCIRAALTGFWVHSISLVILDFRPFPEEDLLTAALATVVLAFFWLLPWIPELIPVEEKIRRVISICAAYTSFENRDKNSFQQDSL